MWPWCLVIFPRKSFSLGYAPKNHYHSREQGSPSSKGSLGWGGGTSLCFCSPDSLRAATKLVKCSVFKWNLNTHSTSGEWHKYHNGWEPLWLWPLFNVTRIVNEAKLVHGQPVACSDDALWFLQVLLLCELSCSITTPGFLKDCSLHN